VAASMEKDVDAQVPRYPNLQSKLLFILHNVTNHADTETDEVYAHMTLQPVPSNYENQHYFQDRVILAPTNEIIDEINDSLLKFFPGDEVEYLSSDTICSTEYINDTVDAALYSPELLNSLRISGLPNHKLVLKVGVPVMLLRNLNQKEGLCN
ncbi:uncharacterized protein LOC143618469, partial [Bidens hawaiensis]|uniref:uncharacterized protein LOC143618469 n=1 Tax=Bidens hawaiensis TaxID=980011 RepID=UPI00404A7D9C